MRRKTKLTSEVILRRSENLKDDGGKGPCFVTYPYKELLQFLQTLTPQQLEQQVQIISAHSGTSPAPINLEPVIDAGTVEGFLYVNGECDYEIHSSVDWKQHPEEVVLLCDGHGFGEFGDTAYVMQEIDGETCLVGNKSGIPFLSRPNEPTEKMGRSAVFHLSYEENKSVEELFARLKQLSENFKNSMDDHEDLAEIAALQAELYRREYRIKD
jgi:hypothetical protein